MLEIDGARYSGSGTIVRQAVAYAALTGQPIRIRNARVGRPRPGLRHQHVRVVQAIAELVDGTAEGVREGSQEVVFRPGAVRSGRRHHVWDVGSAGSTTLLALAVLPILAFAPGPSTIELRGGLFQDFAPSFFHLEQVMLPLLRRMGVDAEVEMARPGYVPRGGGILKLTVESLRPPLRRLVLDAPGSVERIWGIALASRLEERRVSHRMAKAAKEGFTRAGHEAEFDLRYDTTSVQPGAGLAAFADLDGGGRLGADRAGAPRRGAEQIGKFVAKALLRDLRSGAAIDRHAGDQVILFAALAEGESRFRIPRLTDHIEAGAWLAREFLGAAVGVENGVLVVRGVGFQRAG